MGQLSLFSRGEIAGMRDWSAARNHCPERDAFRREHERHRVWGLQRRHAAKLRHLQQHRSEPPSVTATRSAPPRSANPARPIPTAQASPPPAPSPRPAAPGRKPPIGQARSPQPPSVQAPSPRVVTLARQPPTREARPPRTSPARAPSRRAVRPGLATAHSAGPVVAAAIRAGIVTGSRHPGLANRPPARPGRREPPPRPGRPGTPQTPPAQALPP